MGRLCNKLDYILDRLEKKFNSLEDTQEETNIHLIGISAVLDEIKASLKVIADSLKDEPEVVGIAVMTAAPTTHVP